jgi:hypothetical protein
MTTAVAIPDITDLVMKKFKLDNSFSQEQKGALVHACIGSIKRDADQIEQHWMLIGLTYHFITINKLWSAYGSHIRNATDFFKEIDLGISRRSVEHYAAIMGSKIGDYIREKGLLVPMTKLRAIATVVKDTGDMEGWVGKAKALSQKALEDEVREARGRQPSDTCEHPAGSLIRYLHCEKCNKWIRAE